MESLLVVHNKTREDDEDLVRNTVTPNVRARSNSGLGRVKPSLRMWLLVAGLVLAMGRAEAQAFCWGGKNEPSLVPRTIEVLARSSIGHYAGATLGLVPFQGPPAQADTTERIAQAYMKEFLKMGTFREVKGVSHPVQSDQEAIWLSRREGCDLLVMASVLYALGGSGAMPTQLQVDVRILDARLGKVVWHLRQSASSEPGRDRDFFWSTRVGAPAYRLPALAEALACQLATYLVDPTSNR